MRGFWRPEIKWELRSLIAMLGDKFKSCPIIADFFGRIGTPSRDALFYISLRINLLSLYANEAVA